MIPTPGRPAGLPFPLLSPLQSKIRMNLWRMVARELSAAAFRKLSGVLRPEWHKELSEVWAACGVLLGVINNRRWHWPGVCTLGSRGLAGACAVSAPSAPRAGLFCMAQKSWSPLSPVSA
eukprot:129457-Chlamydomonas_euryale.AAC.3